MELNQEADAENIIELEIKQAPEKSVDNLTLFECWQELMSSVESPQQFIDLGFYSMIGAALQRRVWLPRGNINCYPNMFVILVGPPSVGKGRVISVITELMQYHEIQENKTKDLNDIISELEFNANGEPKLRKELGKDMRDTLLFPMPADSSSLRAITCYIANNGHSIKTGLPKPAAYLHSSAYFVLEELVNLFKNQTETQAISNFLLVAWDCRDYRHTTHGNGSDSIKRSCVSMLAGITPDSLAGVSDAKLIGGGFTSRAVFVFGDKPRKRVWFTEGESALQKACKQKLLIRLFELSKLYGEVTWSLEAWQKMKDWYEIESQIYRINKSHALEWYYGRKVMHIMKLCMAIHFADSNEMEIQIEDVMRAMNMLDSIEPEMHRALGLRGNNKLAPVGKKIVEYIEKFGDVTTSKLLFEFGDDVNQTDLTEILTQLCATSQLEKFMVTEHGQTVQKYRLSSKMNRI